MNPDLWFGTSGPPDAKIVIVGEAWGWEENNAQRPFVGSAGIELDKMLSEAGISRESVFVTNIVAARPNRNNMWEFFHEKEHEDPNKALRGLYPTEIVISELQRLERQIQAHPRDLVIAAGNYPLWALTGSSRVTNARRESGFRRTPSGIGDWRGSMWWMLENVLDNTPSPKLSTTRLLPIYHPSGILRAWDTRAPTVHDLRVRVPMAQKHDWRHQTTPIFLAPPTFNDAIARLRFWWHMAEHQGRVFTLAADCETVRREFISCFGFADSVNFAMSIPFLRPVGPKQFISYWTSQEEAILVYWIRRVLSHPNINVVGQNFLYDIQWSAEWFGLSFLHEFDSMLAQNVIYPGTPKDLGYLSSLYCHYHWYWKDDQKDWDNVDDLPRLLTYNCWDNVRTFEVVEGQRAVLNTLGMESQMQDIMRIAGMCLEMMHRGVRWDQQRALQLKIELHEARMKVHQKLEAMVPQWVVGENRKTRWYTSDKQTAELFYDVLGFPVVKDRKTGNRTVNKEALNTLPRKVPHWKLMFDALSMERSLENTHNVVSAKTSRQGRMHCFFSPSTETIRLSSTKDAFNRGMNLMNLTKGEED